MSIQCPISTFGLDLMEIPEPQRHMLPNFLELSDIHIEAPNFIILHSKHQQYERSEHLTMFICTFLALWDDRVTSILYSIFTHKLEPVSPVVTTLE